MNIIRKADPSEASLLSELAFESKSYWKYDKEYLEAIREYIKISANEIECDHVYLYEAQNEIQGFYHLNSRQEESELIWFFVHPRSIGTGKGQILWDHLLSTVKAMDIKQFIIKSDQNAESFYIKQGAARIGFKPSVVSDNIQLPLLKYVVNKKVSVYHYDAFASVPNKGNPAGVVLEADSLSEIEMQQIACSVGFNETVFVMASSIADLRLRYYTPGHEINLCGHATVASLYCLKSKGLLGDKNTINIETNIGILPIQFRMDNDILMIEMKQGSPQFMPFHGDLDKLAASIGLVKEDINLSIPIVYGSTGTWTLLIPILSLDRFNEMIPNNNELFPSILIENPKASIHPFCLETYDKDAFMHARHFSSPYSGTVEDPVTGTASGVMGAYYLTYMNQELNRIEFIVEQGQEIDRDGRVFVSVEKSGPDMDIRMAGTATFVCEFEVEYE